MNPGTSVIKTADGYVFELRSASGEVLLTGNPQASRARCLASAASVRLNCRAPLEKDGEPRRCPRFAVRTTGYGFFRLVYIGGGGRVTARGPECRSYAAAASGARKIAALGFAGDAAPDDACAPGGAEKGSAG